VTNGLSLSSDGLKGFGDGYAKFGVAVHDVDADSDLRDLSPKVPRHKARSQKFNTVHLGLDAAATVVSIPVSSDCAAEVFRGLKPSFPATVTAVMVFPWLSISAGWDDGMRPGVRDRIMALAGIIGDAAGSLACRDLAEQIGRDQCITDTVPRDLDNQDLQCFLVDSKMDLALEPPLGAAMFARAPFAFDPGASTKQHTFLKNKLDLHFFVSVNSSS